MRVSWVLSVYIVRNGYTRYLFVEVDLNSLLKHGLKECIWTVYLCPDTLWLESHLLPFGTVGYQVLMFVSP